MNDRVFRPLMNRRGFTLIELTVVIVIVAVVMLAAYTLLQYSNLTFLSANDRITVQTESRAVVNAVKEAAGTSTSLWIHTTVPSPLPTNRGYAYYDETTERFVLHYVDGTTKYFMTDGAFNRLNARPNVSVLYTGDYKVLQMDLTTGPFQIMTDIYIQNMVSGTIVPVPTTALSGVYIEFA